MTSSKRSRQTRKANEPAVAEQNKIAQAKYGDDSRQDIFPIVGIGASAGGLEALTNLLKALAPDIGMAFIFVPHLDPSRESAYSQILARTTSMPVLQIKEGMKVQPNHVYVIPPNCDLTIIDAALHISDRTELRSVNMTVDIFF